MEFMTLDSDADARYDQHLGTAAETALADGNEQLAVLLADCHIIDVTYLDSLMSLTSDEMSTGVRVYLEAPGFILARFSDELIGELQGLLNASLIPEGETVLEVSFLTTPAAPGWRDRIVSPLNFNDSGVAET